MLQEPAAFATAVQGLLQAQRQALAVGSQAGGEHLCFLGSGRQEEDRYTHMVVASFLQKHTQYVSMVTSGYQGNYLIFLFIYEYILQRSFKWMSLYDYNFYFQPFMNISATKWYQAWLITTHSIVWYAMLIC